MIQFPSRLGISDPNAPIDRTHPSLDHAAPIRLAYLPAALFWHLQSKTFWDSTPPDGKTGFIFPRLFTREVTVDAWTQKMTFSKVQVDPDAAGKDRFRDMADMWNDQQALWASQRPWHAPALKAWSSVREAS
jgi:hypothetical protein